MFLVFPASASVNSWLLRKGSIYFQECKKRKVGRFTYCEAVDDMITPTIVKVMMRIDTINARVNNTILLLKNMVGFLKLAFKGDRFSSALIK